MKLGLDGVMRTVLTDRRRPARDDDGLILVVTLPAFVPRTDERRAAPRTTSARVCAFAVHAYRGGVEAEGDGSCFLERNIAR